MIRARIRYDERTGSGEIGGIQLVSPTFFTRDAWIPQSTDWQPRTQTPVKYDLEVGEGRRIWESCLAQAARVRASGPTVGFPALHRNVYGPVWMRG